MADFTSPAAAEGQNPTQAPTSGQRGIGFDAALPGVDPAAADLEPQITEVDWPPASQRFPDDPAATPGWNDDSLPAISGPAD